MAFRATNWGPRHPFRSSGSLPAQENQNEAFQPAYGLGNPDQQAEQADGMADGEDGLLSNEELEALKAQLLEQARAEAQAEVAEDRNALASALAELETATSTVHGLKHEALSEGAQDMAAVILAVTERVLKQSLALHPDALKTVIQRALEQLPEAEQITVHVSPGTLAQVNTLNEPRCRIVADGDVEAGCVLRSSRVTVDATVEATIKGVDDAVRAWLAEQPWVTEWMLAEVDR